MPKPELRVSDAERNQVVERLNQAVGEGRLSLAEFEDRLDGVLAARTQSELAPFTADLPEIGTSAPLELRVRSSSLKRVGRWVVPQQVVVAAKAASVRLDLADAVIVSSTVEVVLDVRSSSVTVVLPRGASASISDVEMSSSSASANVPETGGLHVVIRGHLQSSSLRVRYPRRFLRWQW
jgi:Domain of unknown function (DUF1707)